MHGHSGSRASHVHPLKWGESAAFEHLHAGAAPCSSLEANQERRSLPMSCLFEPWSLDQLRLPNRIVIAPMCQYSAEEGSATDWHMIHLGHLALSGAGLLILEATAVSARGRISAQDLGLYSDENEAALARVLSAVRSYSPIALAIQLAHAGRKGSSRPPWDGGAQIRAGEPGGWKTEAPSAVPHAQGEDAPMALDRDGLRRVRDEFVQAA